MGTITPNRFPALLIFKSNGAKKASSCSTMSISVATDVWTSEEFTSGLSTTTTAGPRRPEVKCSSNSSTARFPSTASGMASEPLLKPRFSEVTGIARAIRAVAVTVAIMPGRARTLSVIALQMPPVFSRLSRPMIGTLSLFTLSPSTPSIAGNSVRDPTIAISTTMMAARDREMKIGLFVSTSGANSLK